MATAYTAGRAAATIQPRAHLRCETASETYTVAAALVVNDTFAMVKLPNKAVVTDVVLTATDLDTNVSPTLTLSVGITGDLTKWINASTIGQTGGLARMDQQAGHLYTCTDDTTVYVSATAGPATGATSGSIRLTVNYTMDK